MVNGTDVVCSFGIRPGKFAYLQLVVSANETTYDIVKWGNTGKNGF